MKLLIIACIVLMMISVIFSKIRKKSGKEKEESVLSYLEEIGFLLDNYEYMTGGLTPEAEERLRLLIETRLIVHIEKSTEPRYRELYEKHKGSIKGVVQDLRNDRNALRFGEVVGNAENCLGLIEKDMKIKEKGE